MITTRAETYREFFKSSGNSELNPEQDGALLLLITRRGLLSNFGLNTDDLRRKGLGEEMSRKQIYEILADDPANLEKIRDFFETEIENSNCLMTIDEIKKTKRKVADNITIDRLLCYIQEGLTKDPTGEMLLKHPHLFGFRTKEGNGTKQDIENLGITPQMTKDEMSEHINGQLASQPPYWILRGIAEDVRFFLQQPETYLKVALGTEAACHMKIDTDKGV